MKAWALISPRWSDGSASEQDLLSAEEEAAAADMLRRLSMEESSLEQLQSGPLAGIRTKRRYIKEECTLLLTLL
jgi:hypothetical protein